MRFLAEARSCADSIQISCEFCLLKMSYWAKVILPRIVAAKRDPLKSVKPPILDRVLPYQQFYAGLHACAY